MKTRKAKVRVRLTKFSPRFDQGLEQFLYKWIHKNLWKVKNTHTFEDFYQEGYILFIEAVDRYGGTVDNQDWFMSLYKRMLWTWTCDQAVSSSRKNMFILEADTGAVDEDESGFADLADKLYSTENAGLLATMIKQAPAEVAAVLKYVLESPAEVLAEAEAAWKRAGKRVPGGNQFLCAKLGFNHETTNLVKLTQDYFLRTE